MLLLAVVVLMAGCATPSAVSDRMFFGRSVPGGGEVTDDEWRAFVDEVVAPRFPDGFTVWRGTGHWKGDDGGAVSEPACVLEIVHPASASADGKLAEIARLYRERFHQEAVLQVRSPATLTLWDH